jgi:ribosomal protein L40E
VPFCTACGTDLPKEAVFCLKCGARQVRGTDSEAPSGGLEAYVSLGEVPYAILLKDIWVLSMITEPVQEVRGRARPTNLQGSLGPWLHGAITTPRPNVLEPLVNLGDLVRWQYAHTEVEITVKDSSGSEHRAELTLPLTSRGAVKVALSPAAESPAP